MFNIRKRRIAAAAAALTASAALVLTGCSGGGGEAAATYDPDEEVTLNFAFWGNDVRAAMYEEAITAFNEEYPNITVNTSFLGFPEFWEKRETEAAGGGLPDVMQFDYSYLRQYSENGLLLDLDPYLGGIIETDPLPQNILDIGVVNDTTYGIATSTNAWGLFTNPVLLEKAGVDTRVQSAIPMATVSEPYIRRRAVRHMEKGRVVIFAAGTGNPFFTTDTAAALRAAEMGCDALFKGTSVDGVYDADPKKKAGAKRYETIGFDRVLGDDLKIMDAAAVALCRDNDIPIVVFNIRQPGNLAKVLSGQGTATIVQNEGGSHAGL